MDSFHHRHQRVNAVRRSAVAGVATGAIICAVNPAMRKKAIQGCFDSVKGMFSEATPKPGVSGGDGAGKGFSDKVKEQAKNESGDTCVFCGTKTTDEPGSTRSEIDHTIPKSRGGSNTIDNAQNTCRTCNRQKGVKTTEEFLQ